MKSKSKKIILISLAILVSVLIQTIGITYARYISTDSTTGEAEIAKWSFKLAKQGEETQTIKLTNTTDKASLRNGKIAPGTLGDIVIQLDATGSDVDVEYIINFLNEKNKPKNLVFYYKDRGYSSLTELSGIIGRINLTDQTRTDEVKIRWVWPEETGINEYDKTENNLRDTQDALNISQFTFDVSVTGLQVTL